jgi:hypothetical protein
VQPEQHRVGGAAGAGELVVGGQLADHAWAVLRSGVVFEEEPDRAPGGLPQAVPVRVDAAEQGGGLPLGPPPGQPRAGAGAGVGGQVDEELVGPEQVVQAGVGGDGVLAGLDLPGGGRGVAAGGGV